MKYSFPLAWQGMLAISLMLFIAPISYADEPPTVGQCLDAFMESRAAPSCESGTGNTVIVVSSDGQCEITDTCPTYEGEPSRSSITVPLDQVSTVRNCSGTLRLTCPE